MKKSENWKKIPDRLQNTYSLLKKRSLSHIPKLPLATLKRSRLIPIIKESEKKPEIEPSQSSLNDYQMSKPLDFAISAEDTELLNITYEEIKNLIQNSLLKYPNLAKNIKKLEKEKIHCKCSVFSKNNKFKLDHVHGFSSVACASEFCINRILEEPENTEKIFTKHTKYYSLSPEKRIDTNVNKELTLFDQNIENISGLIDYVKHHKSETEYQNMYDEYIKIPNIINVPQKKNRSPNFSIPRPKVLKENL